MDHDTDGDTRPFPPGSADEPTMLTAFLDFQRATLAWKVAGVGADGWRTIVGTSTMTLGGLVKHLAYVEDDWFSVALHGHPKAEPWASVDWSADHDWEWRTGAEEPTDQVLALWTSAVERSRLLLADAMADGGLDRPLVRTWPTGEAASLRWTIVHMIEEYARHNGHADLLREAVDGATGE